MRDRSAPSLLRMHTSKLTMAYYEIIDKYTNLFHLSGCWTNALQPLWIAGKVMSHYSEHGAIVETLIRIEQETGWATAWRVEDLKDLWGDYDNDDE